MRLTIYLLLAVVAFAAATAGADLVARASIGGETLWHALSEHVRLTSAQPVGTALLLAPFVAVAFICAGVAKRSRMRSANIIFATGSLTLLLFYFNGYLDAQQALLGKRWTEAALSIGLLPFLIGIPVVIAVACVGLVATAFGRRNSS